MNPIFSRGVKKFCPMHKFSGAPCRSPAGWGRWLAWHGPCHEHAGGRGYPRTGFRNPRWAHLLTVYGTVYNGTVFYVTEWRGWRGGDQTKDFSVERSASKVYYCVRVSKRTKILSEPLRSLVRSQALEERARGEFRAPPPYTYCMWAHWLGSTARAHGLDPALRTYCKLWVARYKKTNKTQQQTNINNNELNESKG